MHWFLKQFSKGVLKEVIYFMSHCLCYKPHTVSDLAEHRVGLRNYILTSQTCNLSNLKNMAPVQVLR